MFVVQIKSIDQINTLVWLSSNANDSWGASLWPYNLRLFSINLYFYNGTDNKNITLSKFDRPCVCLYIFYAEAMNKLCKELISVHIYTNNCRTNLCECLLINRGDNIECFEHTSPSITLHRKGWAAYCTPHTHFLSQLI